MYTVSAVLRLRFFHFRLGRRRGGVAVVVHLVIAITAVVTS